MTATKNIYGLRLSIVSANTSDEICKVSVAGSLVKGFVKSFNWTATNVSENGVNIVSVSLEVSADVIDMADVEFIKENAGILSIGRSLEVQFAKQIVVPSFLARLTLKPKNTVVEASSCKVYDLKDLVAESRGDNVPVAVVPVVSVEEYTDYSKEFTLRNGDVEVHHARLIVSERVVGHHQKKQLNLVDIAIEMNTRSANEGLEKAVELVWSDDHQMFIGVKNIPNKNGYRFLTESEWLNLLGDAKPEQYLHAPKKSYDVHNINRYGLWDMLGGSWEVVVESDGSFITKGGSCNNLARDCNKSFGFKIQSIYERKNVGFRYCRNA